MSFDRVLIYPTLPILNYLRNGELLKQIKKGGDEAADAIKSWGFSVLWPFLIITATEGLLIAFTSIALSSNI